MTLVAACLLTVRGSLRCQRWCLPHMLPGGGGESARRRLREVACFLRCCFSDLLLVERPSAMLAMACASRLVRWSSPVELTRKSREPNLMLLPGAKAPSLANADELAIEAENVSWHANDPYLVHQLSWF